MEKDRRFDIKVYNGRIYGYAGGMMAFSIWQYVLDDGKKIYRADDKLGGWLSPDLTVVGAWNLARQVDITEEEFIEAFGDDIKKPVTVHWDEFVGWFYINGQTYCGIDDKPMDTTLDRVEDNIAEYIAESDFDNKVEHWDVIEKYTNLGKVTESIRRCKRKISRQIFKEVLLPIYSNIIKIEKRRNVEYIVVDPKEFIKVNKETSQELYDRLWDFVFNRVQVKNTKKKNKVYANPRHPV